MVLILIFWQTQQIKLIILDLSSSYIQLCISCYCLKIRVIFLSAPFQVNEVLLDTYSIVAPER